MENKCLYKILSFDEKNNNNKILLKIKLLKENIFKSMENYGFS